MVPTTQTRKRSVLAKYSAGDPAVEKDFPHKLYRDILRTRPVGYDRSGAEYWLLSCQEHTTLSNLGSKSSELTTDPAVIIRCPNGDWKRHTGTSLHTLISTFSDSIPCEKHLMGELAERMTYYRNKIGNGIDVIKRTQAEYLKNQRKCTKWLSGLSPNILARLSPRETVRMLELLWARCIEARLTVYYASIRTGIMDLLKELDPSKTDREHYYKRKKLRDQHVEASLDFHPLHGWQRGDAFGRVREISAMTIASRILVDPTHHTQFATIVKRSRLRKPIDSGVVRPLPDESEDEEGDAEGGSGDEGGDGDGAVDGKLPDRNVVVGGDRLERDGDVAVEDNDVEAEDDVRETRTRGVRTNFNVNFNAGDRPRIRSVDQLHIETRQVLRRWATGREAARALGVSQSGISLSCKGKQTDAYGFKWKYTDQGTLPEF